MEQPLLTADDVRAVTFATTRIRAGYDMDEVDTFLDGVEHTIAELTKALATARDHETIQRAQLERLQQRVAESQEPATQPIPNGQDPIVREIRERMRRVLTEQLALLDQFAADGTSSTPEPPPSAPDQ
jgi:DivIVA domain-containing protein